MYEVSIATCATKGEPGAACSAFENASALRQPSTFDRNEFSYVSSKDTLAAQWTTWVRLLFRRSSSAASIPNPGRSTSPSTKRNFRAARPATPIRFSSCAPRSRAETTRTTSFVLRSRIVSGRTTETTSSTCGSLAACARISLPRKPVAPVSSTRSRGRFPRAASFVRASFCRSRTRAFSSFSLRCVGSRNW